MVKPYYGGGAFSGKDLADMHVRIWLVTGMDAFDPHRRKRGIKAKAFGTQNYANLDNVKLDEKDIYVLFMTLNALERKGWHHDPEVQDRRIFMG